MSGGSSREIRFWFQYPIRLDSIQDPVRVRGSGRIDPDPIVILSDTAQAEPCRGGEGGEKRKHTVQHNPRCGLGRINSAPTRKDEDNRCTNWRVRTINRGASRELRRGLRVLLQYNDGGPTVTVVFGSPIGHLPAEYGFLSVWRELGIPGWSIVLLVFVVWKRQRQRQR